MAQTPKTTTEPNGSNKRAFWLPDSLYANVRDYVSRHRNSPEDLTINQFVRDALEEKLSSSLAKEKGKRRGGA